MATLNSAQQEAITHKEGPMLVLAGPGSGKTLVITKRTKYLMEECAVSPNRILVITFTKAAAAEMKERFAGLVGTSVNGVNFGTFHAVFFKILRYAYNYSASNIIGEEQKNSFFRDIVRKLELEIQDEREFIDGISSEISRIKGEQMKLDTYFSMNCSSEVFRTIYEQYDNCLRKANLIDFDDMLLMCYELLMKRPDILSIWQMQYEYILIDEFQDINKIQYDIIRMLAKPQDNLFVVGDDDQSIYRFRGAKPEIMLYFTTDYPQAKKILLNYNYRSKKNIVKAALSVVHNNTKRFEKEILTIHEEGEEIELLECKDLPEEVGRVTSLIQSYHRHGIPYSQIAVLYRTNTQPGALVAKLMEYNIPFCMRDAIPNIYEHWITQNILAYIRLAMGNRERSWFLQIANRPKRYLSRELFSDAIVDFDQLKAGLIDKKYICERVERLEYDLKLLNKTNPFAAIHYIRRAIGYDEYLKEYAEFRKMKVDELYEVLDELQEAVREFKTYEEWLLHMEAYKEELRKQNERRREVKQEGVSLSTYHAAKGLEYEIVILIDANEGITPHHKAVLLEDLEEERRMFYVAMTRAKMCLHIYYLKERYHKEQLPTRFLGEMLFDQQDLVKGTKISHKIYGNGEVIAYKDGKISVRFEKHTLLKTLQLDYCVQNRLITIIKQ